MSITKWIQLHHGDKGLKSFFKKCYDSLSKGGTLVLEPIEIKFKKMQKKLDVDSNIEFKFLPEHYNDFLINQLGFSKVQDLGCPQGKSHLMNCDFYNNSFFLGSKIPILLFIK